MNPEKSFLNKAKAKAIELKEAAKNNAKKGITYGAFTLASFTALAEGNKTNAPVKPENSISTENKIPEKNVTQDLHFAQEQQKIQAEQKKQLETLKKELAGYEQQKKEYQAILKNEQLKLKVVQDNFATICDRAIADLRDGKDQKEFKDIKAKLPVFIHDYMPYTAKHNPGIDLSTKLESILRDLNGNDLVVRMTFLKNGTHLGSVLGVENESIGGHDFLGKVTSELGTYELHIYLTNLGISQLDKNIQITNSQISAINQNAPVAMN